MSNTGLGVYRPLDLNQAHMEKLKGMIGVGTVNNCPDCGGRLRNTEKMVIQ